MNKPQYLADLSTILTYKKLPLPTDTTYLHLPWRPYWCFFGTLLVRVQVFKLSDYLPFADAL